MIVASDLHSLFQRNSLGESAKRFPGKPLRTFPGIAFAED
jgi:hypothetical protein